MKNLTFLIPTYNRPKYLRRILNYYEDYGINLNIIVGDSSQDNIKKENKKLIKTLKYLNVKYISYSSDLEVYHKFAKMTAKVKTNYASFCADDDFVIPGSAKKCVEFLEKNSDYALCHGRYLFFSLEKIKNKRKFKYSPGYNIKSNTLTKAESRVAHQIRNYSPTFYAVHKTKVLHKIYHEMIDSNINRYLLGEFMPSVQSLIYGKMKSFNFLYCARDTSSVIQDGYWPDIIESIENGKYNKDEKRKFLGSITREILDNSDISKEKAIEIINSSMEEFIRKNTTGIEGLKRKLRYLFDHKKLPQFMIELRKHYHKLKILNKLNDPIMRNISKPTTLYYDEFNRIRFHVLSSRVI